jgi:hypothetical protein
MTGFRYPGGIFRLQQPRPDRISQLVNSKQRYSIFIPDPCIGLIYSYEDDPRLPEDSISAKKVSPHAK